MRLMCRVLIGRLALWLGHPLAPVSGCAPCSLQVYPGPTPGPPRDQAMYGAYPYGDFIQGYPQAGYLPPPGERSGGVDGVLVGCNTLVNV